MPERISRITMVDAWAGRDGQALEDLAPPFFRAWIEEATVDGLIPCGPGGPPSA